MQVRIDGQFDKRGTFYGTVHTGADSVTDILLKGGWGSFLEWCAPHRDQERMKALERSAKEARLRMWHNAPAVAAPAAAEAGAKGASVPHSPLTSGYVTVNGEKVPLEFLGKVRQVGSAGTITVMNTSVNPPTTVVLSLSSVTVPRYGVPGMEDDKWGFEAREFLRTKLIGKKVRVVVDYVKTGAMIKEAQARAAAAKPDQPRRPPSDKPIPDKIFASVLHDKVYVYFVYFYCLSAALFLLAVCSNIATRLVEDGLARVIFHKGEEKRSGYYEALHVAEKAAEKKGKHMHSNKDAPKYRFNIVDKPAKFIAFLNRGRQVGLVDWVISPTRFRILLPTHSVIVTLNISGT